MAADCYRVSWSADSAEGRPGSLLVGTVGCAEKLAMCLASKHHYRGVELHPITVKDNGDEVIRKVRKPEEGAA